MTNALHNTIPFFTRNPPKHSSLTEEDLLTQRPNFLYVLKLCNDLKMKEGFQIYQSLAYSSSFDWFDKRVMEEIQRFVSFAGWAAAKEIIEAILSKMSKLNVFSSRF